MGITCCYKCDKRKPACHDTCPIYIKEKREYEASKRRYASEMGYTIKNGDTKLFVEKLGLLIHNEEMRKEFSKYAIKRADEFAIDTIMKKWNNIFESLL